MSDEDEATVPAEMILIEGEVVILDRTDFAAHTDALAVRITNGVLYVLHAESMSWVCYPMAGRAKH